MNHPVRRWGMLAKTFTVITCAIGLTGPRPATSGSPAAAEIAFEQHEVITGSAKHQTVLTGFLLGDAMAELAVINIDENRERRLRVFALGDGTWMPRFETTLRPEVLFVDVACIGGRDRLVTYQDGRLNWFDPETVTESLLVPVRSRFTPPPGGGIPHVDITRDVNADGREDLVVPDADGFWVFIQMSDGAFADPVKLGPSTRMDSSDGPAGYRYVPWDRARIHEMDYDLDGRSDLVFWNEDHFKVHHQDENGLVDPVARTFTTDVAFDSDDLTSLAAPLEVRRRRRDHALTGDLTGRVLHSLTDVNGDGIADLVVFSLEGGSLWSMRSTQEVHFGTSAPAGGTVFAQDASTVVRSDGIPFGMGQHDFDGDGQMDMMIATIHPGIFKMIGALLTRSISLDLEFYRMEGNVFPGKPSATRKTRADSLGNAGEKAALFPSVLIGDVNGDGLSDLLVGRSRNELRVFVGVPGPDLFARRPREMGIAMPSDEKHTWLVDLNKDGKQDIFIYDPSTTAPHRVTMLIAR